MEREKWRMVPDATRLAVTALLASAGIKEDECLTKEDAGSAQPMLSLHETARRLNVSVFTVRRMIHDGTLRARKMGAAKSASVRVFPESVEHFLNEE